MEIAQIKKIIENPNPEIKEAVVHDSRMTFYSDRLLTNNYYANKLFADIENKLANTRSIDSFRLNINFPLEINNLTKEIKAKLSEVWNGQNKVFLANFNKKEKEIHFNFEFYRNEFFDLYFAKPNTLIYFEFIDGEIKYNTIYSNQILAYSKLDKNIFEYLIFQTAENKFCYIDKDFLVFYQRDEDDGIFEVNRIELKDNTICPVFHISNENYNLDSDFLRTNIFADTLSYFDLYQEVVIYKKMLSPYAFNLIIEKYRDTNCNYRNGNVFCTNGFLQIEGADGTEPTYLVDDKNSRKRCPSCNAKISPGMEVYKSETFSLENSNVISDVVRFISPDTNILTYSDTFIEKLKEYIINSIIGDKKDVNNNQNSNEIATSKTLADRLIVILGLKSKFEKTIKIIENERAKWLHGEAFNFWTINLGTNFLLSSVQDLYLELEKSNLQNPTDSKNIKKQIVSTKYVTDISQKKKNLILLDFYPNIDLLNLEIPLILRQKQMLFENYIVWYEAKNGNIGTSNDDHNTILTRLNNDFNDYLKLFNENNVN